MNKDKEIEAYKSGNLTPEEQTKYEIAQELGILDRWFDGSKENEKIIVYYLPLQLAISSGEC